MSDTAVVSITDVLKILAPIAEALFDALSNDKPRDPTIVERIASASAAAASLINDEMLNVMPQQTEIARLRDLGLSYLDEIERLELDMLRQFEIFARGHWAVQLAKNGVNADNPPETARLARDVSITGAIAVFKRVKGIR